MRTSTVMSEEALQAQISYMKTILNERQYRCYLGKTALSLGRGGQTVVTRLSGASVNTVRRGMEEVNSGREGITPNQIRKAGGGRKASSVKYPNLHEAIERIIDGKTYGDPEKVIHWTTQSLMSIAGILKEQYGIEVSHTVVSGALTKMG